MIEEVKTEKAGEVRSPTLLPIFVTLATRVGLAVDFMTVKLVDLKHPQFGAKI